MSKLHTNRLILFFKVTSLIIVILISAVVTFFVLSQKTQPKQEFNLHNAIERCQNKPQSKLTDSKEYCYSIEFKNISAKFGTNYAFQKLDELKKIDPSASGCHWIAHGIGTGGYIKDPQNWRNTLNSVSQTCNYGAQHGIVEAYIATLPEGKITPENITDICGPQPLNDCNHIVGHIVLVSYLGDISKSLEACKVFTESLQNHYCNQGVFMENITALNLIDHNIVSEKYLDWAARVEEIKNMCHKYSDPIAMACWEEITHASVQKFPNQPAEVLKICDESPSKVGRDKCKTHSVGIITANFNYDLNKVSQICKLPQVLDPDFEGNCNANIVGSMLSTVPEQLPKAVNFCGSLPPDNLKPCFTMVYAMSKNGLFTTEDIQSLCTKLSVQAKEICLSSVDNLNLNPSLNTN